MKLLPSEQPHILVVGQTHHGEVSLLSDLSEEEAKRNFSAIFEDAVILRTEIVQRKPLSYKGPANLEVD